MISKSISIFLLLAASLASLISIDAHAQATSQTTQDISATPAFTANADDLFNNPSSPTFGNPHGDITVVEFYDYQCSYCKATEESLEKLLQQDKNVKVVFKDFPKLGPHSVVMTTVTLAGLRQGADKYLKLHEALLSKHVSIGSEDDLYKMAYAVGLEVDKLKQDMKVPAIDAQIQDNLTVGKSIGVKLTPTFIINGYFYPGAQDYDHLKQMVDYVRSTNKKH